MSIKAQLLAAVNRPDYIEKEIKRNEKDDDHKAAATAAVSFRTSNL